MDGPFFRSTTRHSSHPVNRAGYTTRMWFTQPRPRKAPLPYSMSTSESSSRELDCALNGASAYLVPFPGRDVALARAHAKLRDAIGPRAQGLTAVAEWRSTVDMISSRAMPLVRAARMLKKGNLHGFARELGLRVKRQHAKMHPKKVSKNAGGLWLKYWLGWAPTVGDIGNAIEVLQSSPPWEKIHGSGTCVKRHDNSALYPDFVNIVDRAQTKVSVRIGAKVRCSNPNLFLANQLGFVNPAATAWELVPLSFVVNWFVSVQEFLEQFSTFVGLEVEHPYTTTFGTASGTYSEQWLVPNPPIGITAATSAAQMSRTPGIEQMTIVWRPPAALSVTRGLTAISLLVQQLKSF